MFWFFIAVFSFLCFPLNVFSLTFKLETPKRFDFHQLRICKSILEYSCSLEQLYYRLVILLCVSDDRGQRGTTIELNRYNFARTIFRQTTKTIFQLPPRLSSLRLGYIIEHCRYRVTRPCKRAISFDDTSGRLWIFFFSSPSHRTSGFIQYGSESENVRVLLKTTKKKKVNNKFRAAREVPNEK